MRCMRPEVVEVFARTQDDGMLQCLSEVLQVQLTSVDEEIQDIVTLPASLGGLGLRECPPHAGLGVLGQLG